MSTVHFVYIVRCADGTLYTGYARDPAQRAAAHNAGCGAKYTRSRRPVALVFSERCRSKSAALRREHALKHLTRSQKEALIGVPAKLQAVRVRMRSGREAFKGVRRTGEEGSTNVPRAVRRRTPSDTSD